MASNSWILYERTIMSLIQNLFLSYLSLIKVVLWSRPLRSNKRQKQQNNGKQLIIVANGPSFRLSIEKHRKKILASPTLSVNLFCCTDYYEQVKPTNYLLLAPQFFKADKDLSELYIKNNEELFSSLKTKTSWPMNLYIPVKYKKARNVIDLKSKNTNITFHYFNTTPIEGLPFISNFIFKNRLGMPRPHNVLIPSLMIGIAEGYDKISVLGADHSWLGEISVNEKNEALVNQKHFYDEKSATSQPMQDYIKRPRKLHEILHKFYLSFKGYWEIKHFAEKQDVEIINSSEISMIDAFEKKDL